MISGLDIRYDVGGPAHPLLGAALPHTRLHTGDLVCTTTELLRSGRGLLLGLDAPPPPPGPGPGRPRRHRHRPPRRPLTAHRHPGRPGPARRPRRLGRRR